MSKSYTAAEAAKIFEVSKVTVIRWIHSGRINAEKEEDGRGGGEYRIPGSEIEKEKQKQQEKAAIKKTGIVTNRSNVSKLVSVISQFLDLTIAISYIPKIAEKLEQIADSLEKIQSLPSAKKSTRKKPTTKPKKPTTKPTRKKSEIKKSGK